MLATFPPLNPRTIGLILSDPSVLGQFVDTSEVQFILKLVILAFLLFYILFSIMYIVQMRRIQVWLTLLHRYHFPRWAKVHLVLAIIGWVIALIVL